MRAVPLCLALLLTGLAACRPDPPPPLPTPDAIGRDLLGTRFVFFEDEEGPKHWTIEEGEVKDVRVIDGVTSADGRSYRARIAVTLAAKNRTIRGDLLAYYTRQDSLWVYDHAARPGEENFAVEEIAAVLYAAEPAQRAPGDSLYDARDVRLEPIARYAEGAYTAPFAPYRDEIQTVVHADYEVEDDEPRRFTDYFKPRRSRADSLRRAAYEDLAGRIAARYFNRAWTLFLLQPGAAPMPVRVHSREAGFDGCEFLSGIVRAPSASAARGVHLATTSSTMGGRVALGRALRADEERAFVRMARSRFAQEGIAEGRLDRLRTDRLYAADLDGDGLDSWVGSFTIAGEGSAEGGLHLVLVVSPSAGIPTVELDRFASFEREGGRLDLVGVMDVDGDGRAELFLRESGYESHRYRILSRPAGGDWTTVFEGGGGGC